MLEQTAVDTLVIIGMFILRIGVPIAILFGLAAWLERKLRPAETRDAEQRASQARIIPFTRSPQGAGIPAKPTDRSAQAAAKRTDSK